MRQYLIAMGIRTVAFPVAVWAFMTERYAIAWVAAFLAIVIPSFAVMIANAVDQRQAPRTDRPQSPTRRLGPAPQRPADESADAGEVLRGEVLGGVVVGGTVAAEGRATSPDESAGASRS